MSTTSGAPIAASTCAKCGMGVHEDEEGRIACDGCGETTEACKCQPASEADPGT
ncbi:MAG: hypothetical protein LC799_28025 [Actinobacteria bacterium]|nr:hypothetical protein [Actinomycetota bacterium]